ncbi:MAG: Ig-like domain-containing protein [Alistipes sp.]|nr:Ig-like domain-containing protein [Candidatus Alistipes equi]
MYSTTMPEIKHNTVAKISLCAKNFSPVPTGFALDFAELSLPIGGHCKLQPQFTPDDTYNKKVLWSSTNPAVATVDSYGMVKALTAGQTTIKAQLEDEELSANCSLIVKTPATAPADALSGLFSVSDNNVVRFAKSNLCRKSDGSYKFFDNQYNMAQENEETELVTWSQASEWMSSYDDNAWRTLSADEWKYLFGNNQFRKGLYAKHVTVVGVTDCVIIYPDAYTGEKVTDENRTTLYNDSSTWTQAQIDGVVCLTPVKDSNGFWIDYWIDSGSILRVYSPGGSEHDLSIWYLSGSETVTNACRPVTEVK